MPICIKYFLQTLYLNHSSLLQGFLDSSVGKESACNARDSSSIPGSGSSPGEGRGYPLQYSWASLVAQLVRNPLAVQETWVWSLGWEDPLEKGKATHSSILAWRVPWGSCIVHGVRKELDTTEWLSLSLFSLLHVLPPFFHDHLNTFVCFIFTKMGYHDILTLKISFCLRNTSSTC